ncbi:MAG: hypothetical protein Q8R18_04665 [bacterium]|nr:hypothetical protein [bacterium]
MNEYLVQYFKAHVITRDVEDDDNVFYVKADTLEDALGEANAVLWDIESKIGVQKVIVYARLQATDKGWHEFEQHCDDLYRKDIEKKLE